MNTCFLRSASVTLLATAIFAQPCIAEDSAAVCACDRGAGKLVIRYTPDFTGEKPVWDKTPEPIHFMSLLILDREGTIVEDTKQHSFTCRLKADTFEVVLEPGVPNPNLLGRCGAAVIGVVTVKRNGATVLDGQEFEALNCHERERYIKSITFRDGAAEAAMAYGTYDE